MPGRDLDYPNLTCWSEGIIRNPDNFDEVLVRFVYWSTHDHPIRDMKLIEERMRENQAQWLYAVGPDPQ